MKKIRLSKDPRKGRAQRAARLLAFGLGPWLLVSFLGSLHHYFFGQELFREKANLLPIVLFNAPIWSFWLIWQRSIQRLLKSSRFTSRTFLKPLLVHGATSGGVAAVMILLSALWALVAFPHPLRPGTDLVDAIGFFASGIAPVMNLLIYWFLLAMMNGRILLAELRQRDVREAQLEAQVARARLNALKMQLQPHFLFNALNASTSLIHQKEPEKAVAMLHRLAGFLRMTLEDTGEQEIPLRRELAFAERYMDIEEIRFPGRLDYRVEVDAEHLDVAVPNLLLQPLLENAVRHILQPNSGRGYLEIRADKVGEHLHMEVIDGGAGPRNAQKTEPMRDRPPAIASGSGLGIGLRNIHERLDRLHGPAGRLEVSETPGGGFRVEIQVPYRRLEEGSESIGAVTAENPQTGALP